MGKMRTGAMDRASHNVLCCNFLSTDSLANNWFLVVGRCCLLCILWSHLHTGSILLATAKFLLPLVFRLAIKFCFPQKNSYLIFKYILCNFAFVLTYLNVFFFLVCMKQSKYLIFKHFQMFSFLSKMKIVTAKNERQSG